MSITVTTRRSTEIHQETAEQLAAAMGDVWDDSDPECRTVGIDLDDCLVRSVEWEMHCTTRVGMVTVRAKLHSYSDGVAVYKCERLEDEWDD